MTDPRLDWRKTHISVHAASRELGVEENLLREAIQRGTIDFDPQPNRAGQLMKVLRRADVEALKARMAGFA